MPLDHLLHQGPIWFIQLQRWHQFQQGDDQRASDSHRSSSKKQIVSLVEQILVRLGADPIADIHDLEERINAKLYELYKLTEAEIELVKEGAANVTLDDDGAIADDDAVE